MDLFQLILDTSVYHLINTQFFRSVCNCLAHSDTLQTITISFYVQTEITIEFIPSEDKTVASYDLCWRVHAQTWEDASEKLAVQKETFLNKPKVRLDAHGLEPGTTYALRLIAKDIDNTPGSPGQELIVDTDGVSCAPKTCCVMM